MIFESGQCQNVLWILKYKSLSLLTLNSFDKLNLYTDSPRTPIDRIIKISQVMMPVKEIKFDSTYMQWNTI